MPDGKVVELSARTIESWYYAHRHGGFEALYPGTRSDCGQSRAIAPEIAELILRAKREKPRRSIRRIIRMLERARRVKPGELSRSSVHRLLQLAGVSARPLRGPAAERRSFIAEHAGDLWVGDALHGPLVIAPDGRTRKSYLLSQIDDATRYIVHSYFALSEGAEAQEYGLKQAILKYGLARAYYVDRGSAYVAHSLRFICAELGIHLLHAGVQDAEAKGVIERWHRTWREEVGDELPDTPLPLAELNAKHWAWLGAEYHAREHDTTGRAPREHLLAEVDEIRPVPRGKDLDEVFLHRRGPHGPQGRHRALARRLPRGARRPRRQARRAALRSGRRRPRCRASSSTTSSSATPCRSTGWQHDAQATALSPATPSPLPSRAASTRSRSSKTSTTGARAPQAPDPDDDDNDNDEEP